MGNKVSVVIPTYKRTEMLKRCLDALTAQTLARNDYEIIVVDDAGTEKTKDLVNVYAAGTPGLRIHYMKVEGNHGPAAARNTGWRAAQGEIIAFTDDDCIPEPDWLAKGSSACEGDVAGVSGRIIVPVGRNPTDHELNTSFLELSEFATANCFYRKSVLQEAGGFDEMFTTAWREDADLFFTLIKLNKKLVRLPEAIVVHPVRTGSWGISIREQSKSRFNALLFKKHPDLYRKHIQNRVLPFYYTIVGSSLLFFLSAFLGARPLAVTALCVWIAFSAALCVIRLQGTSHSPKHVLEMIVTSAVIPFLSIYWRVAGGLKFNVFFY